MTLNCKPIVAICIISEGDNAALIRTLNSLLKLDYQNWFCVVCGSEHSNKIVNVYSEKDQRIKIVEKILGNKSQVRNFALHYVYQVNNAAWMLWLNEGDVVDKKLLSKQLEYIQYDLGLTSLDPCVLLGAKKNFFK